MGRSVSLPPVINSQYFSALQLWRGIVESYNIKDNRERENVRVRQAFAVALSNETHLTFMSIGNIMNKHHATVVHCRKSHESNMKYDKSYPGIYDLIVKQIRDMVIDNSEDVIHSLERKSYLSDNTVKNYVNALNKKHRRQVQELEDQIKALRKNVKELSHRNEVLHDKYARLKNLA